MSFEIKVKLLIIFLSFFLIITSSFTMFMIFDLSSIKGQVAQLREDNISLIEENYNSINDTIYNLEKINNYLNDPDITEKIAQLHKIQKYIDIDDKNEINKVAQITKSTPLDILTASIIVNYTKKLNVPISLMLALIEQESNFNQYEIGEDKDRGYCQIIPGTEKWLAEKYGDLLGIEYDQSKIYNPEYNIGLGAIYLHVLQKSHGNNTHKILSEYNRGVYNLERYFEEHGTYVTAYSRGIISREQKYMSIN